MVSAKIDIDDHLILTLSDGTEIDAGELPKEEAERVINYMSGGGAPNPNIHDLPWHILEGEKKQIGDREQVAIHDVFDLEGDLVLEGSAQLVLTDPLESSGATGANGAVGADGEGVGVFQGARTKFNSDFSAPLGSSDIDWDATDYDTDSFWDISNPERLTVPAGVTRVRLTAGLHDSTSITGQMIVAIVKNGGDIYGRNEIETAGGDSASCGTPVIDVVEGDYFTSTPFLTNARTLDANTSNYLTIEVVSGDVKGSQGDKGDQGIQGDIGLTGADSTVAGPQGDQGIQGETGADGAGSTSAIFYALGTGTANLGTSLGTVPLAAATFADTGYTLSANQITIGAALNGKRAFITWAVAGNGATNRVEIRSELQVDTVRVKGSSNYVSRNATQDQGGVQGSHMMTLSTGDVIRVQALRDGSTANLLADETHDSIQTLD